jgi:hypothetical protein
MEDVIQSEIENLTPTVPEFRGKKAADFIDKSILSELEREGFFAQLANKYGKCRELRRMNGRKERKRSQSRRIGRLHRRRAEVAEYELFK